VGLDLKFLLDDLFAEEIKALIVGYEERCIGKLDKIIKEDRFLVVSSQSLGEFLTLIMVAETTHLLKTLYYFQVRM
jgi:hypothetical protein